MRIDFIPQYPCGGYGNISAAPIAQAERHSSYAGNRGKRAETKYDSAKGAAIVRDSQRGQFLDILRDVTANPPGRVRSFSFKPSGGDYSKLFAAPVPVLSWDNIVWIDRAVMAP